MRPHQFPLHPSQHPSYYHQMMIQQQQYRMRNDIQQQQQQQQQHHEMMIRYIIYMYMCTVEPFSHNIHVYSGTFL